MDHRKLLILSALVAIAGFLAFPIQVRAIEYQAPAIRNDCPPEGCHPSLVRRTIWTHTYFYLSDTFSHANFKDAVPGTYYQMGAGTVAGLMLGAVYYRYRR